MLINLRNALMAGKRLPYDAEVEYLQSSGTQWIDTLVNADSNLSVEITMANAGTPWANTNPTGAILVLTSSQTRHHLNFATTGVRYFYGNTSFSNVDTQYKPDDLVPFTFKVDSVNKIFTLGDYSTALPTYAFDTGLSYWLFGRNGTTPPYLGSLRIYSAKLWNGTTLVRDFISVRKGTVGYLYDRVSGKMKPFGNAGTGDFVLGPDVVPVEWLESGANTYINTGIIPDDTYGMEVTGYTTQTVDSAWIGTRNGSNQRCFMGYSPSLGFYYGWNGRQDIQYTTGVWSTASMNLYNSRKNMMDGTEVGSITETLGAQNRAIYLFGLTANGTLGLKLKSALITKGSDDVQKLVSVRVGNGSTWEGAMMDVPTRRIYRNAGTGAFAYGNDLKYPIPA